MVVLRVFFFILILASLSTVIDLIRDRTAPTAFGTQHFAILLVAWCPAIVFGSSISHFVTSEGLLNWSPQGIFQVFAIHFYLSIAVLSVHMTRSNHVSFSLLHIPCTL
jgi:hypothetical protein